MYVCNYVYKLCMYVTMYISYEQLYISVICMYLTMYITVCM